MFARIEASVRHTSLLLVFAILMPLANPGEASPLVKVPFVGCPSDGQTGPQPGPRDDGSAPSLPPGIGAKLAFYRSGDSSGSLGVLGPRGWHCKATYGSSGSGLFVTRAATPFDRLFQEKGIAGPAIQLTYSLGGTSGRFSVIALAPRYFPQSLAFARHWAREFPDTKISTTPFAADRLVRKSSIRIDYFTPPMAKGLGTASLLSPDSRPITGSLILIPDPDGWDMVHLAIRLPAGDEALGRAILDQAARQAGKAR